MKDELLSIVFDRFYRSLRDKFYAEYGKQNQKKESKDLWKTIYSKTNKQNIASDLFDILNPLYFHRKYDEEVKQHLNVGYPSYPVTVDTDPMRLALKYLLFGRDFESIKKFPSITVEKYERMEPEKKYGFLLELFIKQAFPEGVETAIDNLRKAHKTGIVDEEKLLTLISSNKEFFQPKFLQNLVNEYFEALTQKNYLKAWKFLTPEFHQNSLWDGSFDLFQRSYKNISSIGSVGPVQFSNFSYRFRKASCTVTYSEEGRTSNIPRALHDASEEQRRTIINGEFGNISERAKIFRSYTHKLRLKELHHQWIRPAIALDLTKLNESDLRDADFLKVFSLFHLVGFNAKDHQEESPYRAFFSSRFTFKCADSQWLIDSIFSKSVIELEHS